MIPVQKYFCKMTSRLLLMRTTGGTVSHCISVNTSQFVILKADEKVLKN